MILSPSVAQLELVCCLFSIFIFFSKMDYSFRRSKQSKALLWEQKCVINEKIWTISLAQEFIDDYCNDSFCLW